MRYKDARNTAVIRELRSDGMVCSTVSIQVRAVYHGVGASLVRPMQLHQMAWQTFRKSKLFGDKSAAVSIGRKIHKQQL